MLRGLERFCHEEGILWRGQSIVAACSGGADSMALVQWLLELRDRWSLRLCVAHFEHGIRGEASVEDAEFVRCWCADRGIAFRMAAASVPREAKRWGISLETAAREMRYGFLEGLRRELGYDVIATAHHGDDQAETVLMRILRGSGVDGLAAMSPRSGNLIRPFLSVGKQELEGFCRVRGVAFCHDGTNDLPECSRNRLRLELLPYLEKEYNPKLSEALCRLARLAGEQREYMEEQASRIFPEAVRERDGLELSQGFLCRQPMALQRVLLRMFLRKRGVESRGWGFEHFDGLRDLVEHGTTGNRRELPGGWTAELSYGWLRLKEHSSGASGGILPEYEIIVPGENSLGGYGIRLEARVLREKPEDTGPEEYYCDMDLLPGSLKVRTRRTGDVISLAGGKKSLKKLFIDSHIPREERANIPLITSEDTVLWIPGLRRSRACAVTEDTQRLLYLRIMKEEVQDHDEG